MSVFKKLNKKTSLGLVCIVVWVVIFSISFYQRAYTADSNGIDMKGNYTVEKQLLLDEDKITNTVLSPRQKIEMLDFDGKVVAEYIEFQNQSKEYLGYIIRDAKTGFIFEHAFEGTLFGELLSHSGLTYKDVHEGKTYFVNLFEIYIELTDGRIFSLMPRSGIYPETITKNELKEAFSKRVIEFGREKQKDLKRLRDSSITLQSLSVIKNVKPCIMSDFSNLKITDSKGRRVYPHDHCSPTAATNIMRYFKYKGKSNLSSSYSNNDIFAKFYVEMDTNGGVTGSSDEGTLRSKIAQAYTKVGRDLGAKPKESTEINTSLATIKKALKAGKLLHFSADNFESTKRGHSIVAVSYSDDTILIADGWKDNYRYVNYSSLDLAQVVAVSY